MVKQEIFDKVAVHLLTQNLKSTETVYYPEEESKPLCRYRGHVNGGKPLKCAVGVLIPDDVYSPKMEGCSVEELDILYPQLGFTDQISLLEDLQGMHDCFEPHEWKGMLGGIANTYRINPSILNEFPYF
jgi:hypothetical protein